MLRLIHTVVLLGAALAVCAGCTIRHDLYFYTKAKVVKQGPRLKIKDGPYLVMCSEVRDDTYDPPVEKCFFLQFTTPYPQLNFPYEVGGEMLHGWLLVKQGDRYCFAPDLSGKVIIKKRTKEEIMAQVDVSGTVTFDPEHQATGRREDMGPIYFYRRAADDVREEDMLDLPGLR